MAVENKYVNAFITAAAQLSKLLPAQRSGSGAQVRLFVETFEIAAADDDLSVYRVFPRVAANIVPVLVLVGTDGVTGCSSAAFGLHNATPPNGTAGAVISANCLANALDLSSALDLGTPTALDGLDAMDILYIGSQRLWEIAGHTIANKLSEYDCAWTLTTAGSGAGTITTVMLALVG